MRAVVIISLACALGGCQTARSLLGEVQRVGDQGGINVIGASASETPAQTAAAAATAKRAELPAGLTGDKANRAYTSDAPN